jgi:malonate-semialdehyde dehydrogenase (acetylating)/methylmalonate-semialdehyde dehydrogenase
MIPLWSLPIAIACGNTLLIKPSERDPGAATMLVQLAEKAGVPPGVVSVIHGGPETVNYLCDDPRIKAISFVGGDRAGKHIWDRAGANGKRVQVSWLLIPFCPCTAVKG